MAITITADTTNVSAFLGAFPVETSKAIQSAAVRSSKAMGTQANRVVSRDMGLKVGTVRSKLKPFGPRGPDLAWGVRASSKRIPLIEFGARGPEPSRGKGRGVTYKSGRRGKGRQANAFIATVGAHRGVFKRKAGAGRLPIQQLFGPSVGRVLSEQQASVKARGQEVFEAELHRLLGRIIGQMSGGASGSLPSFGGRLGG
jgi:hypothetical protein